MLRTLQEAILKVFTEYTAAGSKVVTAVAQQNEMKDRPERLEK